MGQRIEQFGIARRIRAAGVVDWMHDAASEKVSPQAIGHRAGEERIVGAGHPPRETAARIVVQAQRKFTSAQRSWLENRTGARMQHVAAFFEEDDLVGRHFGIGETSLATDA